MKTVHLSCKLTKEFVPLPREQTQYFATQKYCSIAQKNPHASRPARKTLEALQKEALIFIHSIEARKNFERLPIP